MTANLRHRLANLRGSCVPQSILDEVSALEAENARLAAALRDTKVDLALVAESMRPGQSREDMVDVGAVLRRMERRLAEVDRG